MLRWLRSCPSLVRTAIGPGTLCLTMCACSVTAPRFGPETPLPKPAQDTTLHCPESDPRRCAIASPLQDLADQFETSNGQTPGPAQRVTIVDDGDESLALRLHLFRAARRSIELQTFIWADDDSGALVFRELLAAARRGVKVRIIADQPFSGADPATMAWISTAHVNLQIKLYNPIKAKASTSASDWVTGALFSFDQVNHRMHNKLIVVDDRIALTGGRNIQDKYFDRDLDYNFYDRDVLLVGPEVKDMVQSFDRYWMDPVTVDLDQLADVHAHLFMGGVAQTPTAPAPRDLSAFHELTERAVDPGYIQTRFIDTAHEVERVEFKADRPQKGFVNDHQEDAKTTAEMRNAFHPGIRSLVLQTPYLVLSGTAIDMLQEIRAASPDFSAVVSTNSLATTDAFYVYAMSFKHKKRYVKTLGMTIHEVRPVAGDIRQIVPRYQQLMEERAARGTQPVLSAVDEQDEGETESGDVQRLPVNVDGPIYGVHQKSMVIDDEIAIIGSHNFDPRSAAINTEATLMIWDRELSRELSASILRFTQPRNSYVIAPRQSVPVLGHISGVFGSISRLLPIFDIWPFRYTSSFELKEGKEAVDLHDPAFYDHYRDVGQFPQVGLTSKQIQTRIVGGFGGVFEPLM